MAREIELKIRLDDHAAFQQQLALRAVALGSYQKSDTYFRGSAGVVRVRESEGRAVVCRKDKVVERGIEVSRETEFGIDDAAAFSQFVRSLGFDPWYRKEKSGQAWRIGPVLIEEGTVSSLGWFAELEILLPDEASVSEIEEAKGLLFETLTDLGVGSDAVEPRTYAQLLGHRAP